MATRRATRPASDGSASKNIENNPMQRKQPLEKKGSLAWMLEPQKNILTRRANHRHVSTIAPIVDSPMACLSGSLRDRRPKISIRTAKLR
jgi:hypothetical protein